MSPTFKVDNSLGAGLRVAMAQVDRLRRSDALSTSRVARGDTSVDSTRSAVIRLDKMPDKDGPVGMTFIASAGQLYEVECFGGFTKAPPVLALELPSGQMTVRQSSAAGTVEFRAVVAIGEKGGEVSLTASGGSLVPGMFFMRATAL